MLLTTYAVTSAADAGPGTLRDAIAAANANPGADSITFSLPGPGPYTISPASALPAVTDALSIDGTTQSGFDPSSHAPVVVLDGSNAGGSTTRDGAGTNGLAFSGPGADGSTVRGLQVSAFTGDSVLLDGASHCVVAGNYLGTDGSRALSTTSPHAVGVYLTSGASYNRIGGPTAADRNVVSGEALGGILLQGSNISYNSIQGNYVGTDATGSAAVGNLASGIFLGTFSLTGPFDPDLGNSIGGTGSGEGNVIAANGFGGSLYANRGGLLVQSPATGTLVAGNRVGANAAGTAALPNSSRVAVSAPDTTVGGTSAAARNLFADGIIVSGTGSVVEGNYIGTDASGTRSLGYKSTGLSVYGTNILVGGTAPGSGNLISGNGMDGLDLDGISCLVQGNFIGTDASGTAPLGNAHDGIVSTYAFDSGNVIGGTSTAARNVISANGAGGILLQNVANNTIEGNFIGSDATGTAPLPNGGDGILLESQCTQNLIGGTADGTTGPAGAGNLIAFNAGAGIAGHGNPADGLENFAEPYANSILSNSIFSNGKLGIDLSVTQGDDGVTPNTSGGPHDGANHLQNFPVLTSVSSAGGHTTVAGSLNSTPDSLFLLQFFSNPAPDPSGYGQGQTLVGSLSVTTDDAGDAPFSADLPVSLPGGSALSATATAHATGDTSEFSQDLLVASTPAPAPAVSSGVVAASGSASAPGNQPQRSEVRDLTVSFSEQVVLGPGAFTLLQLNTGGSGANNGSAPTDASAALGAPRAVAGSNGTQWSIPVLAGTAFSDASGSLNDGIYQIVVNGSKVNAAGGTKMAGSFTTSAFHRLYGDADGNGTVNASDYARFKTAFGSSASSSSDAGYNAAFDFDNNGTINALDYAQFKKRFGMALSY